MKAHTVQKAAARYQSLFSQAGCVLIPVKIKDAQDFFLPQDCLGVTLSPQVSSYLDSCVAALPRPRAVTVAFYSPPLSCTKKEAVCSLIKIHYALCVRKARGAVAAAAGQAAVAGAAAAALLWWVLAQSGASLKPLAVAGAALAAAMAGQALGRLLPLQQALRCARRLFAATVEFHPAAGTASQDETGKGTPNA